MNRFDKLIQVLGSVRLLRALVIHGVLTGAEHRKILQSTLSTVVDIGANKGQFALAVRRWAPQARVISFEPLTHPADVFSRVFAGDEQVMLHRVAIGPTSGIQTMHVSAREDSSSLLPISTAQTKMFPGTEEKLTMEVQVSKLNEIVQEDDLCAPALLKLDVQGYEYDALTGCEELLPYFKYIYCECSYVEFYTGQKLASDVANWLKYRGFSLDASFNHARDKHGKVMQADFLFRRD